MKSKGQATMVSAVLYTLITIVVVAIVLQVGLPYITKIKEYGEIRQAETAVKNIDEIIAVVASEGSGAKRRINITLSDSMDINGNSDIIAVTKTTTAEIVSPRRKKLQGNYFIGANLTVDAYATAIGDTNVLVMENEYLYFAVKKLDTNTPITLDDLVVQIRRKDTNAIFYGKLDFYLDNYAGSTVNVSTRFENSGYNIGKGHIIADVYGATYHYKINFVLESGFDFVRIYISDLE
ncbi:MAG: hypothetical protein J7L44_03460 [Candidatus Diapherotrites archaeon]|nr:hypothetical protein [Candidatus Diapherotrites archaeon]